MSVVEIGLVITGAGLALTALQVVMSVVNEHRRSQPIVITHEVESRGFAERGDGWRVMARITNEGLGPAFNVRFGVTYYGVRFAFRLNDEDPASGNRQRVLQPGQLVPPDGAWPIQIPSGEMWAGKGVPEESEHFYWARYANAQGKTWETRNSPDRSADLDIRRVRFISVREGRESRKRRRLTKRSAEVERAMLRELRNAMDEGERHQPDNPGADDRDS